jgi:hypothetical protein
MIKESKVPITSLVIEPRHVVLVKESTGAESRARDMSLGRHFDAARSYFDMTNLSKTKHLKIFVRHPEGLKEIALPDALLDRIAEYLRREKEFTSSESDFDCSKFVHFVNDIPLEDAISSSYWDMSPLLAETQLQVGDTIMIAKPHPTDPNKVQSVHFAMYIGYGHFLSKGGPQGRLSAQRLSELLKSWPGKFLSHLRPRKTQPDTH